MANTRQALLKQQIQQTKARSANYSIRGPEDGVAFSNGGATGAITLTLPKAVVGEEFWFYVAVAQTLTVAPQATDTIGTKGAGVSYAAATVDNFLCLKVFVTGHWTIAINAGFA